MQQKINKKGQGKFKLQTIVKKLPIQTIVIPGEAPGRGDNSNKYVCELQQEFKFTSIRAFIKDDKDKIAIQAKQLHEKELIDLVRITSTKINNNFQGNNYNYNLSCTPTEDELNTLSVSPALVIEWDDQRMFFVVKTPVWFNPSTNNSLAFWIIFYFEIALWIHYFAYVRARFRVTKETLDPKIFISKQNQFINVKNELQGFWKSLVEQAKSNNTVFKEIGQEIYQRSLLLQSTQQNNNAAPLLTLTQPDKKLEEPLRINQLNGGLISVISHNYQLHGTKILEALMQNQEPELFFNELCLVGLNKINSNFNQLERILVEVLREKLATSIKLAQNSSSKKNQKKKNKKKLKSQLVKADEPNSQLQFNNNQNPNYDNETKNEENEISKSQNNNKTINGEQQSKCKDSHNSKTATLSPKSDVKVVEINLEKYEDQVQNEYQTYDKREVAQDKLQTLGEDNKQAQKDHVDEDEEQEEPEEFKNMFDFSSNQDIIQNYKPSNYQYRREDKEFNDLLSELLSDEPSQQDQQQDSKQNQIKPQHHQLFKSHMEIKLLLIPAFSDIITISQEQEEVQQFIQEDLNTLHEIDIEDIEKGQQKDLDSEYQLQLHYHKIVQNEEKHQEHSKEEVSANSESTDDIQNVMANKGSKYSLYKFQNTPLSIKKPEIDIDSHKNVYSSDVGESASNFIKDNTDNDDSNSSNTAEEQKQQQISISPQKKFISKCDLGLSKSNETKKDLILDNEESINKFQIIRSSKNFNQQKESISKGQTKKKKKRSKAVGPSSSTQQQQQSHQNNKVDQSSRLNTFMRNIIKFDDDFPLVSQAQPLSSSTIKQDSFKQSTITNNNELRLKESKLIKETSTTAAIQSTSINTTSTGEQRQFSNGCKKLITNSKRLDSHQIYVRKTDRSIINDDQVKEIIVPKEEAKKSIQENQDLFLRDLKSQEFLVQKSGQQNKSQDDSNETKHASIKSANFNRFENFINQKDNHPNIQNQYQNNSNTKSSLSYSYNKDKKKKSNNKSKNNKKTLNPKMGGNNGVANGLAKQSGVMTPKSNNNPYDSNNGTHLSYNLHYSNSFNSYQLNSQNMHMSLNHQQFMSDQLDYQQDDINDMFRSMANQKGIQYLQQLIHQAMQQNNLGFQMPINHTFNPQDNTIQNQQEKLYNSMEMYHSTIQDPLHSSGAKNSKFDQLSEQFYDQIQQNMMSQVKNIEKKLESVRKERETAISILESIIKQTYNRSNFSNSNNNCFVGVKMYGSMASKLAIEQSDVDLAVVGLDCKGIREIQIKEMRVLYEQLDQFMKTKSSLQFIDSATVPVIKLQIDLQKIAKNNERTERLQQMGEFNPSSTVNEIDESMRFLGVDITFEDSSKQAALYYMDGSRINLGIQCISYIQELCMRETDLKPIVLILKKLLQNNNLNQPYHGGLNSYSLVLMTSAFLNRFSDVHSMSKSLIEFLRYFGYFFDPETTMIDNQDFIKVPQTLIDPMTVIDPLNKLNNTTRSTFRIREIQEVFQSAYTFLNQKLNQYQNTASKQPSNSEVVEAEKVEEDFIQILLNNNNSNSDNILS